MAHESCRVFSFGKYFQSQNIYNQHRKQQNQTLFNDVSKVCLHTDDMDTIFYTQLCGKCLTVGPLEEAVIFLQFAHVHGVSIPTMANCKLPKAPVCRAGERGAQSALGS